MSRKKDEAGCILAILGLCVIIIGSILTFIAENPTLCIIIAGIIFAIIILIQMAKKAKRVKAEKKFQQAVAARVAKWKEWEQNGVPSIQNKDLALDDTETLLYSFPYLLKVGAGNKVHRGTLYLTNARLLFMADTTVKDVAFDNILSVNGTHEILHITPKKKEKMLHLAPRTNRPDVLRFQLADTYAIWFLLNRGRYLDMEQRILTILGVEKQNCIQ